MQINVTFDSLEEMKEFSEKVLIGTEQKSEPKKKTEKKQPKKEEPEITVNEEPANEAPAEPEVTTVAEPEYTLEQVRAALAEVLRKGKQQEASALVAEFGADKLTDITPDKYPEFMKKVGEL